MKSGKGVQLSSRTPVQWMVEHQGILCQLINTVINPPVLAYTDFELPFTVHTNAPKQGLGAVL